MIWHLNSVYSNSGAESAKLETIGSEIRSVKAANCLTKNLLEMDSLPQIKNLLEMSEISSAARMSGGVKDEVNDEREKTHRGGHGRAVSAGAEAKEDRHPERVCGADRVRAELCGDGVAQSGSGGNSESKAAGAWRCG